MGHSLQQIKKKLKVANNIAKLSKIIEMTAISKLYKEQYLLKTHTIYTKQIKYILQNAINNSIVNNQHINTISNKQLLYIMLPDKGLCGDIVIKLTKKINSYLSRTHDDNYIVIIGKSAKKIFNKSNYNIFSSFDINISKYDLIYKLMKIVKNIFIANEIIKISIAYTKFKSIFEQEALIEEVWPIKQYSNNNNFYVFEPSVKYILIDILPYYIEISLNNALLNACASEQAARIIAMKHSRDNAYEVLHSLTNSYNKARQEKITNDILDLSNGK
jgi:F-type H+-transporting ATPase subunit gamma